jgi:16S rRNA (cytosine967-C5)-methyltransferase
MTAKGAAARIAALDTLRRVRDGARFEPALDLAIRTLSDPDRRLTHEIAAGVLRTRGHLDGLIEPLVAVPWPKVLPDVRDLLRIGAYQLRHLDRVPRYAAISATVEAAKHASGRGTAGLVNAVLRRLAREDEATEPAGGVSHPAWLVERWERRFGTARTEALLKHNDARPELTLQPLGASGRTLHDTLEHAGIDVRPASFPPGLVISTTTVPTLPGYREGTFIVQDAAQRRLLTFADFQPGARVWDACAAPGGKAAVLATSGIRVLASDRNRGRVRRLRHTLGRVARDVPCFVADATHPPMAHGSLDHVLVDAPCSATGTIARHPDARWRLTPEALAQMVVRQRALLDAVAPLLKPDGILVYLTCSLEPEENEEQIDAFLTRHPGFCRDRDDLSIFPPDTGTDGGYGARVRKRA